MKGINKVIIVGHLGDDPEVRYTGDSKAITNIRVATSESWNDKSSGEKQERTEWHRIVFFGKLAEIAGEYLKKGSLVYVEGALRTRKWQDKEGADRYSTEIIADEMQMLGGRQENDPATRSAPKAAPKQGGFRAPPAQEAFDADDFPF